MRIRVGGPVPLRFELNALMAVGLFIGVAGAALWAAAFLGYLRGFAYGEGAEGGVSLSWSDAGVGVTLAGIALYFLGRIVQLVAHFRGRS